jgi:hypothetical protein
MRLGDRAGSLDGKEPGLDPALCFAQEREQGLPYSRSMASPREKKR